MRALFILNPASGRRRDHDRLEAEISDRCGRDGITSVVRRCGSKTDLDGILDEARAGGTDLVVAVGGDGTVHEIGIRLIGSPMALGILPTGSGNGLARHLGVSLDPLRAIDAISTGRVETIDTAAVEGEAFLGVAGVGFDAEVAHRFGIHGRRGLETYVRETILLMRSYRAQEYRIFVEGTEERVRALLVAVANSSQYGNQARIAPDASLRDGLLDVCILEQPPLLSVPLLLTRLFSGRLRTGRGVTIRRGRAIEVIRETPGHGHLDGEPVELPARLRFTVNPGSLRILVPSSGRRI